MKIKTSLNLFNKYLLITLFFISTFNTNVFAQACNTPWDAGTVYNGGATSSYNGRNFTAKYWTQGNQPNYLDAWGAWTDNGTCSSCTLLPGSIGSSQSIPTNTTPNPLTSISSATASNGNLLTYQWQKSTNNSTWTDIAGANSSTYSPGAITSKTYFRRKVSAATCGDVYTTSILINIAVINNVDTDGDGILDSVDLDDDNDGILDCVENGFDQISLSNVFNIKGSANYLVSKEIQLTQDLNNQAGSAMSLGKIDFNKDFNFNVELYLGANDGGADGMAIVLHNDPNGINAVGVFGSGLGASGIQNGIAIEFDTWDNSEVPEDHTQIKLSNTWADLTPISKLPNIEDGAWHLVNFKWDVASQTLSYSIDGNLITNFTYDLVANVFNNESDIYFGFTAGTGGAKNEQKIRFPDSFCSYPILKDSDNDGIENSIDLDSDGDGCADAIEGGATFTTANTTSNRLSGSVDANGVPVIATASGQAIGSSDNSAINDPYCPLCPDNENDEICDNDDLDDDNDGILDNVECGKSNFQWSSAPTLGINKATGTINGVNYTYTSTSSVQTTPSIFNHGIFPSTYGIPNISSIQNLAANSNTLSFSSPVANPVLVFSSIGSGGLPVGIQFNNNIEILWSSSVVKNSDTKITGTEGYAIVRINGLYSSITFDYLVAEGYANFMFGADFITQTTCDTDNDGIPDYFDSDSDNDGCADAIEGGGAFTKTNLVSDMLTGGVDVNGIPVIATSTGQAIGSSKINSVRDSDCGCVNDNDQDGICDETDLDDDNDGILDTQECVDNSASWDFETPVVGAGNNMVGKQFQGWTLTGSGEINLIGIPYGGIPQNAASGKQYVEVGGSGDFSRTYTVASAGVVSVDIDFANWCCGVTESTQINIYKADGTTLVAQSPVITTSPTDMNNAWIYKGSVSAFLQPGDYIIKFALGNYQAFDNVKISSSSLSTCDLDSDGIINSLDTDADGDGCADAIEGGAAFTTANLTGNSLSGSVNSQGVPVIATASGQTVGTSQNLNLKDVECTITCTNPVIGTQPSLQTICVGDNTTFTVAATGTTLTYQWYENSTNSNVGGTALANAGVYGGVTTASMTLTAPTVSLNGKYYYVVVKSAGACPISSNAVLLTVNALPIVSVTGPVCIGATITASPSTGGTWTSSDATKASITNAGLITGVAAGTATFTFTNTATNCQATTASVTVNALPIVSASGPVCVGATITASPTTGGTWTSADATKASITNAGLITGVAAGTATFTFTNTATNCQATTASVTVNALPIVSASGPVCVGATITANPTTGGTWTSADATKASITNAGLITGVAAGTATFTFTNTATNCQATTASVTVNALPIVSTTGPVCVGSTITATPTSGGTWTSSDATKATITNAGLITGVAAGTATFTFTNTATNCQATTASVTVNALPNVTGSASPSSICTGSVTTLKGSGANSYTWDNSVTDNVAFNPTTTKTYTVNGTDANGCVGTDTAVVTVTTCTKVTIVPDTIKICKGDSAIITAQNVISEIWTGTDVFKSIDKNSIKVSPINNAIYYIGESSGYTRGTNIIVNGNFESGSGIGFSVDASCTEVPATAEGTSNQWSIGNGVQWTGSAFKNPNLPMPLPSGVGGKIFYMDGGQTPNIAIYRTQVSVVAGNSYEFSAYVANMFNDQFPCSPAGAPELRFAIDGEKLGFITGLSVNEQRWTPFNTTWTSTKTGTINIELLNNNTAGCGNDFAIDAIEFVPIQYTTQNAKDSVVVIVNALPTVIANGGSICTGESKTLTATGSTSYTWSPNTNLSATTGATVVANPTDTIVYTVTGTDAKGCVASDTAVVTVNSLPTVQANGATICAGDSKTITVSGATSYSWSPNTNLSATTGNSVAANPTSTIVYSVTGTDVNGCASSDTAKIIVNALPIVTGTATKSSICIGGSTTLNGAGASSYTWDNSVTDNVVFNPTTTKTYTVTGTDANACKNTGTISVTVNALPIVTGTATTSSICLGGSTTLKGSGASSYTWDNSVTDNVAFNPTTTKTYTVTGTDANACKNTGTVSVTVNALPIVTGAATTPSICIGSATTLNGSGASSYTWDNSVTDNVAFNPTTTKTYTVTGTDANGCKNTGTVSVTVNALPTVVVNGASICTGSSKALTVSGANSYSWSPNTNLSSTTGATVTANPSNTITYTVNGTDSKGCIGTDTAVVTVNNLPLVEVEGGSICSGSSKTLSATGANTYLWSPNTYLSAITGTTVTANPTDTIVYTVTGTDSKGCEGTDTATVIVKEVPPTPTFTALDSICQFNTNYSILNNVLGNDLKWYTANNGTNNLPISPQINTSIAQTNTYYVSQTIQNCESNKSVISVVVKPQPNKPRLDSMINICQNQQNINIITNNNIGNIKWFANQNDIAFSQLQPVINSATIGTQYLWASNEISNCESEKLKIQLNTLPNPSLTAITPEIICLGDTLNVNLNFDGVPNFTLVYENLGIKDTLNSQNGVNNFYLLPNHDDNIKFISLTDSYCTTTYLNFLQPYIVSQLPTVSLTAKDTICNNQSASLNIQMDIANANYQWTNDIKLPFTKAQIISQTHDQLVEQINNLSNAPQKITYTIKGYNGNCLGETKSKSIVIMPSYEPELPIDEPTICKGDDYTIEIRNPNLGYKIKWLKNDTLIQSVSNKITEKINQNTVFTLKYTDYCGSTDELIHNVYIHENQNLSKFQLIDSCLHFRSTIKATIPTYLNQTIWNFNNDADIVKTNNANETIVNYIFPTTGKNTISVKGYLNNCLLLDSNLVVDIVNCDIEVKNTFTPNDDGQNDFWEIQDIEKYPNASIEIFDRWGQKIKVINKNIPHQAWDGKNEDGTLLECGTYYYIIHCNNPILNIKGYINLYK